MIKKPFFGFTKTRLKYPAFPVQGTVNEAPVAENAIIAISKNDATGLLAIKAGDTINTGQKIKTGEDDKSYFISPVTGTISEISQNPGYLGKEIINISIDVNENDQWDDEFEKAEKTDIALVSGNFLRTLPGTADFSSLLDPERSIDTIIINGIDSEPLIQTNQAVIKNDSALLKEGIDLLKKMTSVKQVILTVPPGQAIRIAGADIKEIELVYPDTLPQVVMMKELGKIIPQGGSPEDAGVCFINAEGVVSLAKAFSEGKLPVDKTLTVINKEGKPRILRARIGTPIKDVLSQAGIVMNHGDRLIIGGPMRGRAAFSEDEPIMYDTDAIMAQDKEQIVLNSDIPCVNCGECVRACPTKVPVNMLVRLLENSLYEEAAREYDLLSCIECGLCSYVCIARIPVYHYIMLGKFEFARLQSAEGSHA